MADQFLAEIRLVPFNFAPVGWALCNGQILPISQNTALFSLLGTFYGGNGTSNFALPNLQGQVPINMGQGTGLTERVIGEAGGNETVTLNTTQLPNHSHPLQASGNSATTVDPSGNLLAASAREIYVNGTSPNSSMQAGALESVGGSQPHENRQQYLVMNYIIALEGIYPPRS